MFKNCMLFSLVALLINNGVNAQANRYDVVIDEIMADPTPQVGLPTNEWIEIKNTSQQAFDLKGWRIGDASGQSGAMPVYNLKPDSVVIICTGSAVAAMSAFGNTIAVTSFPSLDNAGDVIYLKSVEGKIIHAVNYTDGWYQNELKKDGGWSLEMIDTKNPCSGFTNWRASTNLSGGTPGKKNAEDAANNDATAPQLLRAYAANETSITLFFDEPVDSAKGASINNYSITNGIGVPLSAVTVGPVFDKVNLTLSAPLLPNTVYTITANGVTDCVGNNLGTKNTARVGLSVLADSLDVVINEILFNPLPNGTDYVEIYNRSSKIIDLKQVSLANRNSNNEISSIEQLSADNYLLFPQDYLVVTESPSMVKAQFIAKNLDAFITLPTMPSYNDDKSNVIVLNGQGKIVDELKYDEKWHFKLIDNREGVALERIDYNAPTQDQQNWHSAATSIGYGTPTYKNSQFRMNDGVQGEVTTSPQIVSPDNDGMDDFLTIDYNFPESGYVANITIFDASGRPIRYLQRNALSGIKGYYRWDGLGEKNQKLPVGIYIIYTEVFNLQGKTKKFKNTVVLARK
jgi:hypothetical protein